MNTRWRSRPSPGRRSDRAHRFRPATPPPSGPIDERTRRRCEAATRSTKLPSTASFSDSGRFDLDVPRPPSRAAPHLDSAVRPGQADRLADCPWPGRRGSGLPSPASWRSRCCSCSDISAPFSGMNVNHSLPPSAPCQPRWKLMAQPRIRAGGPLARGFSRVPIPPVLAVSEGDATA